MMFFNFLSTFVIIFLLCSDLLGKDGSAVALMYHRFEEDKYPSTSISKEGFYSQLLYLKENNFNVLPVSKLIDFFYDKKPLPPKTIFITVDDAYKSFYKNAFPILKKFDFPFSVFLSTNYVSKNGLNDFMSWDMLREIKKNKGSIFNHSHDHKSFIKSSLENVERNILLAENILNKNLGKVKKIISYPYGESNKSIHKLIEKLDYKIAFAQYSAPIDYDDNKFNLPRFSINDEYGKMQRFKKIVNSKPLKLKSFEIFNIRENENSLELKFQTDFDPSGINCFINDGSLIKEINNNLVAIKLIDLNQNKRYRVNCTLFKNKVLYWFGKMIIKNKGKFSY